jgi:hypothetical protein
VSAGKLIRQSKAVGRDCAKPSAARPIHREPTLMIGVREFTQRRCYVLFQTYYRVDPWDFEPPLESFTPVRFDDSGRMFSLFMRYEHAASEGEEPEVLVQTLHRKDDVPADVRRVFAGETKIEWKHGRDNQDGFNDLPDVYRDFISTLHADMDRMASELFNVVRWRTGIVGGPLALTSHWCSMRWHDATKGNNVMGEHGFLNRQMIAGGFTLGLPEMQHADFGQECRAAVEGLLQLQSTQPLYHDLFREAWQLQHDNPRSALVMGIAAAETGFKTALVDLNPSVTWIIENLPSPPLDRMLRDYMSQLPARTRINGEVRRPPSSVITTIKQGIELRNKLVHGRQEQLTQETTRRTLEAVRDLLYMLDYYRGHEWALDRLSPDVATSLTAQ